jgi:hypothetical protein
VKEINVSGDKVSINVSDIKMGAYLIEIKFVSGGSYSASVIK